jgi:hypothetical protein
MPIPNLAGVFQDTMELFVDTEKAVIERRALFQAREFGHAISHIEWDDGGHNGISTCTRCGDGVLLYIGSGPPAIHGTACETACTGNTCDHGWQVCHAPGGGGVLRCLHCGATRADD